ncbi:MAG: bifunctional folylpolyglutamate synthase/dihydrofolate synthase [Salinivirgaceae bacterium]|nr:bifunctional folylpolyglutamate synthase/dihydrofolate synthase [Salinivirgaceae bacterium]
MTYTETLDFLFAQLPMYQRQGKAAYKANLDNTLAFDNYFKNPHKNFKTIHVAGTNGKGSVSHMIASILQEAGFKTGLYTSPHLIDFRERIKINGEKISENSVVDFVDKHKAIIEEIKPSFFEMTVAMAFNHFSNEKIDIAVIEVGMGGRLDSTNIINPMVSIITNIGLDHTQFLGNTLEEVAREKAGIIKDEVPVIIGELKNETKEVFTEISGQHKAPICFAPRRFSIGKASITENCQQIILKNIQSGTSWNIKLDLLGSYQEQNTITVMAALQILIPKLSIPKQCIIDGFANVIKNTELLGRWQIIQNKPKVICDTGHNKEGIICVVNQLRNEKFQKLHIVFGTVDDKNLDPILTLLPANANYYFTKASIPRALNENILKEKANILGLIGKSFGTVIDAYKTALQNANENDLIFIGGSTFVVADLLDSLNNV